MFPGTGAGRMPHLECGAMGVALCHDGRTVLLCALTDKQAKVSSQGQSTSHAKSTRSAKMSYEYFIR